MKLLLYLMVKMVRTRIVKVKIVTTLHSSDDEHEFKYEFEVHSDMKNSPTIKVHQKFSDVIAFRRALNHYAIINEFEYTIEKSDLTRLTACCEDTKCEWRIHASTMDDNITFQVKKLVETHSCTRTNKCGNKRATQGWIANVIRDKIKSDGDISATEIMKWLMMTYNVDVQQELLTRNKGSIIDIAFEIKGDKKHFQRFFICLEACSKGFIAGCRPYISLDACHLKEKFNGVLAAAAIGTPNSLVISSDMQKGLGAAITQVYPDVEHRECMRHMYSNFKKQFRGDFFKFNIWGATNTYSITHHNRLLEEISKVSKEAIVFLNEHHNKIWSRSKFRTTSKCDYITNNISKSFNSWIGDARFRPVLDLLNSIREMLMNLGVYQVRRKPSDIRADAFIAFTRDANWDSYVDPYFTIDKFKEACALEISPIPDKDQWAPIDTSEKIYPPVIKRPVGRPKKNRIVPHDETKKRRKCRRCGGYGHLQKTCKRSPSDASTSQVSPSDASTSEVPPSEPCQPPPCKRGRVKNTKAGESNKSKTN
ncbi:uncharacterized protein Tco_1184010 [Tanacetum coccineum]